jgi:hypothetical protein
VEAVPSQQPGAGKLVKVAVGGKLHRRGRKGHFPRELQINKLAGEGRSDGTCPATRSGKACKSGGGRKTPQRRVGGRSTSHVN